MEAGMDGKCLEGVHDTLSRPACRAIQFIDYSWKRILPQFDNRLLLLLDARLVREVTPPSEGSFAAP